MNETTGAAQTPARRGVMDRFLTVVERGGNRLPDPVTIFAGLAVLALIASAVVAQTGLSVVHPRTGESVHAVNLLSAAGLRQVFTGVVTNFTGFAPLGTVLVAMIGIGVAERAGLFAALLKALVLNVPGWAITPTVIFAGIMSNIASDAGYVILTPLAAMLYASLGRHPLAGLFAAFAGIAGGFSANLALGTLDPLIAGISNDVAIQIDPQYRVYATANYYFMFASVFLLTAVGTVVSDRVVEKRLGPWSGSIDRTDFKPLERGERRGLWLALVVTVAALGAVALLVAPRSAILRDPVKGDLSPFYESIVGLLMIVFILPGLAYGLVTRAIKSDRDAAKMMGQTMSTMGTYIVMAFFAGQLIAYFNWSNLGLILAVTGANALKAADFTGIPLMVSFVAVAAAINLFMASASAKWALMAPVFIPMMMALGYSPEATQGLYRVGDSITNCITPLNYYFPIIIAVAQRYVPNAGLGTIVSSMLPYSIAFGVAWTAMIVVWLTLGLPIGPGAPLTYPAG